MVGFSSYSRSNKQNRDLQKSSGMKLFTKFGTAASANTDKKRISLSDERIADANQVKNRKLISTAFVVFVFVTALLLSTMKWLGSPVL